METYHKIQTLFKRDLDGSLTGQKGKMIEGQWTTPELEYLAGNDWEFTEKVDGTNIRIGFGYMANGQAIRSFGGRSDNAVIPQPLLSYLGRTFVVHNLSAAFPDLDKTTPVVLFGEGYGSKIQNGGNYVQGEISMNAHYRDKGIDTRVSEQKFVLFDVKIGPWWLTRENVDDIASKLGIDSVPVIGHGTLYDAIEEVKPWPIGTGPLKSIWGDFEAEGLVCRPAVPMFDRKGSRIICKVKAIDFK